MGHYVVVRVLALLENIKSTGRIFGIFNVAVFDVVFGSRCGPALFAFVKSLVKELYQVAVVEIRLPDFNGLHRLAVYGNVIDVNFFTVFVGSVLAVRGLNNLFGRARFNGFYAGKIKGIGTYYGGCFGHDGHEKDTQNGKKQHY